METGSRGAVALAFEQYYADWAENAYPSISFVAFFCFIQPITTAHGRTIFCAGDW